MMSVVLSNPNHPEYGVATIPFPIPHDQYAYCMELLEALEIGDAVKTDCKVEKINSFYDVLKRTEMEHMRPSAHISEQTHTTSMPMYSSPMGKTLLNWIGALKASALIWKPM